MKRIAVFASGGGTDFQSVIDANEKEKFCEIAYLVASKEGIGAIDRAQKHGIATAVFSKRDYPDTDALYKELTYLLNIRQLYKDLRGQNYQHSPLAYTRLLRRGLLRTESS